MSKAWKRGRGKLGVLAPLLGSWTSQTESERGPVSCTRTFVPVLGKKYVQLTAVWNFENGNYEEIALFGADADSTLAFWSFTSDGKQAHGVLADVRDIHAEAVGFEAQMPAGLARQAYWPDGEEGFRWAVESHSKKGWRRFVEHHYLPT